jgi:hypothetical protein
MEFIPVSKSDFSAIDKLNKTTNDQIKPHLLKLLEWLQDINWPVAIPIAERLAKVDKDIVPYLNTILTGEDPIWKYHVISNLLPRLKPEICESLMGEVVRIINQPTSSELAEEVHLVAKDLMVLYSQERQQ